MNIADYRRIIYQFGLIFLVYVISVAKVEANEETVARIYVMPRLGIENSFHHFTDPDSVTGVELSSPSEEHHIGASFGADFGRHWGAELALDYVKTNLVQSSGKKAGDYGLVSMLGQVRYRYPLYHDKLVPYALFGGGIGHGDFSGREDFTFTGSGKSYSPLGVTGAGIEYFIADNISVGLEAKYYFLFRPEIELNNELSSLNADGLGITMGMRVYLDNISRAGSFFTSDPGLIARDTETQRKYIAFRGGAGLFSNTYSAPDALLDRTTGPLANLALGINFDKHWGAEFQVEGARSQLRNPAGERISGYPIWSFAWLGRYRSQLWDDRLSPYLLAGVGWAFGEGGDPDQPLTISGFDGKQDNKVVGLFGTGLDYFIEDNVSLNLEVKYTTAFDNNIRLHGNTEILSLDYVTVLAGLRIYFP